MDSKAARIPQLGDELQCHSPNLMVRCARARPLNVWPRARRRDRQDAAGERERDSELAPRRTSLKLLSIMKQICQAPRKGRTHQDAARRRALHGAARGRSDLPVC
jgi:hypothetical protein